LLDVKLLVALDVDDAVEVGDVLCVVDELPLSVTLFDALPDNKELLVVVVRVADSDSDSDRLTEFELLPLRLTLGEALPLTLPDPDKVGEGELDTVGLLLSVVLHDTLFVVLVETLDDRFVEALELADIDTLVLLVVLPLPDRVAVADDVALNDLECDDDADCVADDDEVMLTVTDALALSDADVERPIDRVAVSEMLADCDTLAVEVALRVIVAVMLLDVDIDALGVPLVVVVIDDDAVMLAVMVHDAVASLGEEDTVVEKVLLNDAELLSDLERVVLELRVVDPLYDCVAECDDVPLRERDAVLLNVNEVVPELLGLALRVEVAP
jgi:hypothetical protein